MLDSAHMMHMQLLVNITCLRHSPVHDRSAGIAIYI